MPTEEDEREYRQLIATRDEYREVYEMAVTTFERGVQQGREEERIQALQWQRQTTVAMIEKRFGKLSDELRGRLERMSLDELSELCLRFADARSLDDLQLS